MALYTLQSGVLSTQQHRLSAQDRELVTLREENSRLHRELSQYKNEYVRVSIMKLQAVDPIVVGRRIDLIHRGPVLPILDLRPP